MKIKSKKLKMNNPYRDFSKEEYGSKNNRTKKIRNALKRELSHVKGGY